MLMIKYRPFPCPPPSSPTSIRSSRLRSRIRSLPPSLVIEETSPVSDIDIETDSQSVSRRLILLRHAKSSWDDRSLRDHDRPLKKLQQLDWIPQLILSRCMGHNRGWEEAASMFSGASIELKTCNAALLEAPGKSWEEAFASAGLGGWKFQGMVKPSDSPKC
ncbi:hypothetical protein OIU85_000021 [Salix viminalis]|uniref:Uncharacterized protein n=1 Tax=Salix viminalis TaxID=40686 RepID=A0A9Q0VI98_SALVM|nr:hypothetical protein OIU85_000021 [Salix viminalis]